jgi:hypothetical protein
MLLADLLGVRDATSIGFTAHALANAFADLALPLDETAAPERGGRAAID